MTGRHQQRRLARAKVRRRYRHWVKCYEQRTGKKAVRFAAWRWVAIPQPDYSEAVKMTVRWSVQLNPEEW